MVTGAWTYRIRSHKVVQNSRGGDGVPAPRVSMTPDISGGKTPPSPAPDQEKRRPLKNEGNERGESAGRSSGWCARLEDIGDPI